MKVVSWNVNGLRACAKKGFLDWLEDSRADVVGLQEVRAEADQLTLDVRAPAGWHTDFFPAAIKKGYSGVGFYTRQEPEAIITETGIEEFDVEGRIQHLRLGELSIWNVYFPNGSGKNRNLSRIPYKLRFYDHLRERLQPEIDAGGRVLVMGDFNTALEEIDLARPKTNHETSGFRPEERASFSQWLDAGWVDTFRNFEPEGGHYTWWSQRGDVRARNIGWRIDYVLASPAAQEYVLEASIHPNVLGSDHCPISVDLDPAILR